jgi:hypothetical protein
MFRRVKDGVIRKLIPSNYCSKSVGHSRTQRPRPSPSQVMDSNRPRMATHVKFDPSTRRDFSLRSVRLRAAARSWIALFVAALLSTVALSGCLRPYSKSVFDPPTAQFPGITSQWNSTSGSDIRVLFVHGICTHYEATWITAG